MSRTVFIAGGMGGIGKACVKKFISQGDTVTFTYAPGKTDESELADFLAALGEGATALAIDLSNPVSIKETLSDAFKTMGGIDTLVNAAAVGSASAVPSAAGAGGGSSAGGGASRVAAAAAERA
jgi:NAD(P)-dependent dehydrogenase (short-subunit alcohol dehydrogenase family)